MLREVPQRPSRPAKGEVLTPKVMRTVGSSTRMMGSATGASGSARVSPMEMASSPAMTTMSPAVASGTSTRSRPWWVYRYWARSGSTWPSSEMRATACPALMRPAKMRPTAVTPR
jgi:hypothetical protein